MYKQLNEFSNCSYNDCKGSQFVEKSKIKLQQELREKSVAKSFEVSRNSKLIKRQVAVVPKGMYVCMFIHMQYVHILT